MWHVTILLQLEVHINKSAEIFKEWKFGFVTDIFRNCDCEIVSVEGRNLIVDVGDHQRHVRRHFVAET